MGEGPADELANASQISMETDNWERKLSLMRGLNGNNISSFLLCGAGGYFCCVKAGSCGLVCVY